MNAKEVFLFLRQGDMGEQTILQEVLKLGTEVGKLTIEVQSLSKLSRENSESLKEQRQTLKEQGGILVEHTQLLTENTEVLHFIQEKIVMSEEFKEGVDSLEKRLTQELGQKIDQLEQKVDNGFAEIRRDLKKVNIRYVFYPTSQ